MQGQSEVNRQDIEHLPGGHEELSSACNAQLKTFSDHDTMHQTNFSAFELQMVNSYIQHEQSALNILLLISLRMLAECTFEIRISKIRLYLSKFSLCLSSYLIPIANICPEEYQSTSFSSTTYCGLKERERSL